MRHLQPFLSLTSIDPLRSLWVSSSSFIAVHRTSRDGSKFISYELNRRRPNFYSPCRAVERDSEFEVDPDKAREALRKLDQQLQSLSEKQVSTPKIRASDLDRVTRDQTSEVDGPEFEGSLGYIAVGLVLFTIFYNVLFFTVIQPSIDGPELAPATSSVREASKL
ncbi:hypothetical protein RJ639_034580 [Escallonia herrerae]|uniref:Uncharacterized protein n=1 Tax=Escallonia herrerae TaxID=1293975 RepID=A0AA89BG11_9ASTE|nr:hypothetical protein RJ639_034580 [Escallonia herrerae]